MVVSSVFVIRQDDKDRVIHDQTANDLNAGISAADKKIRLDSIKDFGSILLHTTRMRPWAFDLCRRWKSDVLEALRSLPGHPLWQLCQIITVDGLYHVDRRAQLGGAAWPRIWCAVNSLVIWIAIHRFGLPPTCSYLDDNFSVSSSGATAIPDGVERPAEQNLLLRVWAIVGVPWKQSKQLSGSRIPIIGFDVDLPSLSLSLPEPSRLELVAALDAFAVERHAPLHEWQKLAGHLNWALNIDPWAWPGLAAIYAKIAGKSARFRAIHLTNDVRDQLAWLCSRFASPSTVRLLEPEARPWTVADADIVITCDACWRGAGFHTSSQAFFFTFASATAPGAAGDPFVPVRQGLSVLAGLLRAVDDPSSPKRIGLRTDNSNVLDAFNSLAAVDGLGVILRAAADIVRARGVDIRVEQLAGVDNSLADALSRQHWPRIAQDHPAFVDAIEVTLPNTIVDHLLRHRWLR